jgi:hypothetical protein
MQNSCLFFVDDFVSLFFFLHHHLWCPILSLCRIQGTSMTVSEILRFHWLVMHVLASFCLLDDHGDDAYHVMAGSKHFDGEFEITSWFSWKVVGRINVSGSNLAIESWVQFFYCCPFCTCCVLHNRIVWAYAGFKWFLWKKNGDNLCVLLGLICVVAMCVASIFKMASKPTPKELGYTMPGIKIKWKFHNNSTL